MIKKGYEKYFEGMQKFTCCICGCDFYDYSGNNPDPVEDGENKVCCLSCNERIVSKEREK